MKVAVHSSRPTRLAILGLLALSSVGLAQEATNLFAIDLAAALRLADAQNLDIQIARSRVAEAQANQAQAQAKFFPWIQPGVSYRRHDGNIQDVQGNIFGASKQSYSVGGLLASQVDLGDAIYASLAARQMVKASEQGAEVVRRGSGLKAAIGYFELARAKAGAGVARDALRIATDYAAQVARAVEAGIAFKGDVHRAEVRMEQNRMLLRQAEEQQRVVGARLAQTLRLDPQVALDPREDELAPLVLVDPQTALASLVDWALIGRPELQENEALVEAARQTTQGTKYGPLIPTVGAQANFYGLGGGRNDDWGHFDDGQDYQVGLGWRLGPGGLFDGARKRAAAARQQAAQLDAQQARDAIVREVVETQARARSLADQVDMARRSLLAAEATFRLTQERKVFGVGAVLEAVQAEQEFTRARLEFLAVVARHNQAQFELQTAVGQPPGR